MTFIALDMINERCLQCVCYYIYWSSVIRLTMPRCLNVELWDMSVLLKTSLTLGLRALLTSHRSKQT